MLKIDLGQHVVFTNEAGSIHFTRYKDGHISPMVDPEQEAIIEYAEGYLENKAKRDAAYAAALVFLKQPPKKGWLERLFSR